MFSPLTAHIHSYTDKYNKSNALSRAETVWLCSFICETALCLSPEKAQGIVDCFKCFDDGQKLSLSVISLLLPL